MHKGIYFFKIVALHLYTDCMGPFSKQSTLEADVTAEMQISLSEVPFIWQIWWNIWGIGFHSELSLRFLDCQRQLGDILQ